MATMIPADVENFTTKGESKFYKFLKFFAIPDSEYISWYSPDVEDKEPDFILFNHELGLIVFEVKDWALDQIREIDQKRIVLRKGKKEETHTNPIEAARLYKYQIMDKIREDGKFIAKSITFKGKLTIPISHGIILTNINKHNFIASGFDKIINIDKVFFWDDLHPGAPICCDKTGKCFRQTMKEKYPPLFACNITKYDLTYLKQLLYPNNKIELPERDNAEAFQEGIERLKILDNNQESIARQFKT